MPGTDSLAPMAGTESLGPNRWDRIAGADSLGGVATEASGQRGRSNVKVVPVPREEVAVRVPP